MLIVEVIPDQFPGVQGLRLKEPKVKKLEKQPFRNVLLREEGKLCPRAIILYVHAPKKMANSISNLHQNWVLAVKHKRSNAGTSPNLANCPRPDKSIPHI